MNWKKKGLLALAAFYFLPSLIEKLQAVPAYVKSNATAFALIYGFGLFMLAGFLYYKTSGYYV